MLYTLDEVIDGRLRYISYHVGLTDEEPEPGTPDYTDLPHWTKVTADWMRELIFAHPEIIEKMLRAPQSDIRFLFRNAANDIMHETILAFRQEHGIQFYDVSGNRIRGYTSLRTRGLLDQSRPRHGF